MKNYKTTKQPSSTPIHVDTKQYTHWQHPQLTEIGLYYPLGPCRMRFRRERLTKVLNNLPKIFGALSLEAVYHDAPISATLRSLDQVEFVVTILGARSAAVRNEDAQDVILEIQRRDGDCVAFHRLSHQILHALTTGTFPTLKNHWAPTCWSDESVQRADMVLPRPSLTKQQATYFISGTPQNMGNALDVAWAMLSTERHDAQKLGLESLVHMTNPIQSGWANACWATSAILSATTSAHERIGNVLLEHVCFLKDDYARTFYTDFHSFSMHPCYGGSTETDFAYLALMAISHLLSVAATYNQHQHQHQLSTASVGDNDGMMDIRPFLERGELLECLLRKVRCAESNPHDAYHAIQCLTSLCQLLPDIRSEINNNDVLEAEHFGEACHWGLRVVSHRLLTTLGAADASQVEVVYS